MSTSIKYSFEFLSGIHLNGSLKFNRYTLKLELFPTTDNDIDHNVAFDRMSYVINEIAANSIFVVEDETDVILKYAQAGIPVLTVPQPGPVDQIIQFVLTAKLNSVIEDTFYITTSSISSELGRHIEYVYSYQDDDDFEETEIGRILSDEVIYWWNDPAPRFVTLTTEEEVSEFVPDLDWVDMDLHWDADEDYEVDGLFDPTPSSPADGKSNIVHFKTRRNKNKDED
jgi:hypothetical protein